MLPVVVQAEEKEELGRTISALQGISQNAQSFQTQMQCREEKHADMESKDAASPLQSLVRSEGKGDAPEGDAVKELFAAQSNIQNLLAKMRQEVEREAAAAEPKE